MTKQNIAGIRKLLRTTSSVVDRFDWLANKQSRKFNVFDVLGRATDEVHGHSAFIGELLNPVGSHGQGDDFLQIFFAVLAPLLQTSVGDSKPSFDAKALWRVSVERQFGSSEGKGSTGRIDLVIESRDTCIIIENKIYAADQERQLERYDEYGKSRRKIVFLIYLTLNGDSPLSESLGSLSESKVLSLSYENDISNWINQCISHAALIPHLRETLVQYHSVIQRIASGINNKELTMELSKLISEPENFRLAWEIETALPIAKAEIHLKFWEDLKIAMSQVFPSEQGDYLPDRYFNQKTIEKFHSGARGKPRDFGLNYLIATTAKFDYVLSCGIDYCFTFGFRVVEKKLKKECPKKDVTESSSTFGKLLFEKVSDKVQSNKEMWWIEPVPVLRWDDLNDLAIELALKTKRQQVVDKIKFDICKVLKQILPSLEDDDEFKVNGNIILHSEKLPE